ncbi:MAG TPA: NAD(P)H-dependent oxidoreductase [Treponemataceae bacterium]|nr:NAD(P)H-dependent oxidoreductase [Treponemataceae bacterium]
MKITAINGSAKGERSNSREIIAMIQSMVGEDKPIEVVSQIAQFRKPDDAALRAMAESDVLVIASSLYVDGLPASLMTLLDRYSAYLAGIGAPGASLTSGASSAPGASKAPRAPHQRVFGVVNCGFFEGQQNECALRMLAHFCEANGLEWCGGAGIGTGEMIGMMKDIPPQASIRAPVVNAVKAIADAIAKGEGGRLPRDAFAQHKIPWIMFKLAGEMGWRSQAKKNGLKARDLFRRPMDERARRR